MHTLVTVIEFVGVWYWLREPGVRTERRICDPSPITIGRTTPLVSIKGEPNKSDVNIEINKKCDVQHADQLTALTSALGVTNTSKGHLMSVSSQVSAS
jgi:hypothetical protein